MAHWCSDCTLNSFQFAAHNDDTLALEGAIRGTATKEGDGTTIACLTYFGEELCSVIDIAWDAVWHVGPQFPCGARDQGFLTQGRRQQNEGEDTTELPAVWLAWVDGNISSSRGPDAGPLLPSFACH